jgi:ABC-type glycerol-3-phosphate transport system substrate-binding protein
LTADALVRIDPSSGAADTILRRTGTVLGDPSVSVNAIAIGAGGAVAAVVGGGGISVSGGGVNVRSVMGMSETPPALYLLTPAGTLEGDKIELRVTSLYNSDRLRKAANEFERAHPGVTVTIESRVSQNESSAVEDHIRALNTDLLAGKGGDVLILDGLPYEQYVSRGVLKDIGTLADELGLLPGIREGSKASNGNTYMLPVQFSFSALWGKKDAVSQVNALTDLPYITLNEGQSPMFARSPADWLSLLYPACEESLRGSDGRINFDSDAFTAFLETVKMLYDAQGEMNIVGQFGGFAGGIARQATRAGINPQEMLALFNGSIALNAMNMSGLMQVSAAYSLAGGADSACIIMPGMEGEGSSYIPSTLAGVSARSQHTDLAEEFIRTLFSDEVQSMFQLTGLPSTSSALDSLFEDQIEASESANITQMMMIPGAGQLTITQPSRETWEYLRGLCDKVGSPSIADETLLAFITEETAKFFDGSATAAEAARAVHQRAFVYLNE